MAVKQIVVCQQIVESGRRVVVVVAVSDCETCLRGGCGGYDYDYSPDYFPDDWNQET